MQLEGSGQPRYQAIADALERDVAGGRLRPGDALPTHRELAEQLGVTVGTVTRGYAEAARRGLVRGETGRGTFVAGQQPGAGTIEVRGGDVIQMGMNLPLETFSPDLGATLAELASDPALARLMNYQHPEGLARHREAGAIWAGRFGVRVDPERILVCAGAQHATLVALSALLRPGDRLAVEALTYPTVKTLARQMELKLVPVPVDSSGMDVEALERIMAHTDIRGVYIQTGCSNPTTATLTEPRRQRLAELALRHDLRVVEDDSYGLTVDHGLPTLAALLPEHCVFIASTSKMLCGGLRVGYLAAPEAWVGRLKRGIMASTWMAAPLMAEIAARWILGPEADRVVANKTREAEHRNRLVREHLRGVSYASRPCGHFIWVELPPGWSGTGLADAALDRGVAVSPSSIFAAGQCPVEAVRVSLSGPGSWLALRKGLRVLTELFEDERGDMNAIL